LLLGAVESFQDDIVTVGVGFGGDAVLHSCAGKHQVFAAGMHTHLEDPIRWRGFIFGLRLAVDQVIRRVAGRGEG